MFCTKELRSKNKLKSQLKTFARISPSFHKPQSKITAKVFQIPEKLTHNPQKTFHSLLKPKYDRATFVKHFNSY